MRSTWSQRRADARIVARLARARSISPTAAALLVSRGHSDPDAVEQHLRASPMDLHDPFLFSGMDAATARLERAVREGETVLVHGDYDVDGVTGTALLVRLLQMLGGKVEWHIPNRLVDGYSFGDHSVRRARETGASVVISVDNGTSAVETITALRDIGVDTVVTDHHEPPLGALPPAVAIVNPKLTDSTYPWRELCGGAVAFKLAWGLAQRMGGGRKASPELKRFLEEATALVAIATVCDVVPLLDENRIFARFGLKSLEQSEHEGLKALRAVAGLNGRHLDAEDVGFQIGPRINASGRLGSAQCAVELLLCDDAERARGLATQLDELNQKRKEIEQGVLAEAREEAQRYADAARYPVLVLAGKDWHQGVVGIVAARLMEEFGRPAIVIGLDGDLGRGSARTVDGFDVLGAMRAGADHMLRFGGHAQAAGCEVQAGAVDELREAICKGVLGGAAGVPSAVTRWTDGELPFAQLTRERMHEIDSLEPFGPGNEKPIFVARDVRMQDDSRAVGNEGRHLLLTARQGAAAFRGICFGRGDDAPDLRKGDAADLVYTPRWNTFRGQTNLEILVHDVRAVGSLVEA